MLRINIQNVEELIFQNNSIWSELPDLLHLRNEWKLGKLSPDLRNFSKKAILEFLNKLEKQHENIISKHLGTSVTIDKIDNRLVKNYDFCIDEAETKLNSMSDEFYSYYFTTHRKNNKIFITFWR